MEKISFMQPTSPTFPKNAREALSDANLQEALKRLQSGFVESRTRAAARIPEFDALRDQARDIKDHVLAHLDIYLELFESQCKAQGGNVHWGRDTEEVRQTVLKICQATNAKTVTKGKSMIGEEIAINQFLEANDIKPIETDLGEFLLDQIELIRSVHGHDGVRYETLHACRLAGRN